MEGMPLPGDPEFFDLVWRKQPAIYRGHAPSTRLDQIRSDCLVSWARPPARARIFVADETGVPGGSVAREIPSPELASQIYAQFRDQEPVTLLLNHVERTDVRVRELQQSFRIPYAWRLDNAVATFSTAASGIGYHAGHEDGFIVQVAGIRRWRVWSKALLSPEYLRYLLRGDTGLPVEPRPSATPLVNCTLLPGDTLYIPALFPHEGVTQEDSISLSLGWKGISTYHALLAIAECPTAGAALRDDCLELIPDFLDSAESVAASGNVLRKAFADSGIDIERNSIEAYLWRLAMQAAPCERLL